jgi:glycosyltransferase involved in cell wall biosynthesis
MKIYLENVNLHSSNGPNSFARKLVPKLQGLGHEMAPPQHADINLCFIESNNLRCNIPLVQRLDGIYFNTDFDYDLQNKNIKRTYKSSNGVIFQSNFNKKLITKYFGEHEKNITIHNGADVETIQKTTSMENNAGINLWCCASSWRPHKRLQENIRYFLEHKLENDILIVAGAVPLENRISDPNILYFGNLTQLQLYSLYKSCKYFIHLAWLDHCPNEVVDARASGCQIICSNAGGTQEVAGPDAIIIEEKEWDFRPIKLYNPPKLNFEKKLDNAYNTGYNIDMVAKEYADFMEKLCR